VRSSNFHSVRGVSLLAAIIDEIAFLRDESSAVPDVGLYRALKPALATTGGLTLGVWAQRGLPWSKYRKHFGRDDDGVRVWRRPVSCTPASTPGHAHAGNLRTASG
jgi:hypothetical protein